MSLENYIIDFAITNDGEILIIELNPWYINLINIRNTNTDPAMFSWNQNLKQLKEGPFEFRYREKPMKSLKGIIISFWSKFFD
jgi:hypothetical protein